MATLEWYENTTAEVIGIIDTLPDWMRRRVHSVWKRDGAEVLAHLCAMLLDAPQTICFIPRPGTQDILIGQVKRLSELCQQLVNELRADQESTRTAYRVLVVQNG